MNEFKGMSRDTQRVKTPTGMWEFARNILLRKGFTSISNEYGNEKYKELPGLEIGRIPANEKTVIFTTDNIFSYIIVQDTVNVDENDYAPTRIVIKSKYLGFKKHRPIEGLFLYNYKKELIVSFCDGNQEDSNTPKLINLDNLNVELDADLELVNPEDINKLELFISGIEGNMEIKYNGDFPSDIDVAYITYAYVTDDNKSTTPYFPLGNLAYPSYNFKDNKKQAIEVLLTNLDERYPQIVLAIVVSFESGLKGYKSAPIGYSNQQLKYSLFNLANFTETSADGIIIPVEVYDRIKTMTIANNQMLIGNPTKNTINLQKYVNKIELGLKYVTDKDDYFTHPTLMPDEVYAFYLQAQLKNGTYTDAYVLIGPEARDAEEKQIYSQEALNAMGLDDIDASEVWRKFHIVNTGEFVLPAPYDENDEAHNELHWGYWQNEENYPNTDEFNSVIDYNGNNLGGIDHRNTPVKYFRVPGLDNICKKIPNILGYTEKNTVDIDGSEDPFIPGEKFYGRVPRFGVYVKNFEDAFPLEIRNQIQGYKILTVKREEGNRLVEDNGFCIRAFQDITNNDENNEGADVFRIPFTDNYTNNDGTLDGAHSRFFRASFASQYGYSYFYSNQSSIYKNGTSAKLIKANYIMSVDFTYTGIGEFTEIKDTGLSSNVSLRQNIFRPYTFNLVRDTQRYATIKEVKHLPGYNVASDNEFSVDQVWIEANNSLQTYQLETLLSDARKEKYENRWSPILSNAKKAIDSNNIDILLGQLKPFNVNTRVYDAEVETEGQAHEGFLNVTLLNLQKNINIGLNPTNFITIGKVNLESETSTKVLDLYGDVFTNNSMLVPIAIPNLDYLLGANPRTIGIYFNELYIKGGFSVLSNTFYDYPGNVTLGVSTSISDMVLNPPGKAEGTIFNEEGQRSLNDLSAITAFNPTNNYINTFPFRVARSLKVTNENLQVNNIRTFLLNDYYEMPNNKGEIITIKGMNKQLFISQEYSLFLALIKDRLVSGDATTFLAEGELFDRTPDEIRFNSDTGYIGNTSQFACFVSPVGLVLVDQVKGKVFIVNQEAEEISANYLYNWFETNLNTTELYRTDTRFSNSKLRVDNPFTEIGIVASFDLIYQRLLITKKDFKPLNENVVFINGFPYLHTNIFVVNSTLTLNTNPINGQTITVTVEINETILQTIEFTFVTSGTPEYGIIIGGTVEETLENLAQAIVFYFNNYIESFVVTDTLVILGKINDLLGLYTINYVSEEVDFTNIYTVVGTTEVNIPITYTSEYFEEISKTISYSPADKVWVCEHDYYPTSYYYNYKQWVVSKNVNGNTVLYIQNSKTAERGRFFDVVYPSYIDLIFNSRLDLSKLYQNISWESVVKTLNGATLAQKTIDKILVYNEYQCSGEVVMTPFNTNRSVEGVWNTNDFRDLVINPDSPIVDSVGNVILTNINNSKSFFDKSNFISTFIVVRLIMNNGTTNDIYINNVQVKSRISAR